MRELRYSYILWWSVEKINAWFSIIAIVKWAQECENCAFLTLEMRDFPFLCANCALRGPNLITAPAQWFRRLDIFQLTKLTMPLRLLGSAGSAGRSRGWTVGGPTSRSQTSGLGDASYPLSLPRAAIEEGHNWLWGTTGEQEWTPEMTTGKPGVVG